MHEQEMIDGAKPADNIRVCVRIRPLNEAEMGRGDVNCLRPQSDHQTITFEQGDAKGKTFTFDLCMDQNFTQENVFDYCGVKDLINSALQGYSSTVFAYGQTGSGKTFTMSGPDESTDNHGMIPRAARYLFDSVREAEMNDETVKYTIRAAYLEIYNEQVNDLLNPSSSNLPVRWAARQGFFVESQLVVECQTLEELSEVVVEGMKNRKVASHEMNKDSSRSHSIFTVHIDGHTRDPNDPGLAFTRYGKINFVDLAGSERLKESKASGETAHETGHINKSLLTLGKVISVLGDPRKKGEYVPYRDSKLTKLLMDSLGGTSKTLMIACASPAFLYLEETLNTLKYASRTKNIRNKPIVQMDPQDQLIHSLREEIRALKSENGFLRDHVGPQPGSADPYGAMAAAFASMAYQQPSPHPTHRTRQPSQQQQQQQLPYDSGAPSPLPQDPYNPYAQQQQQYMMYQQGQYGEMGPPQPPAPVTQQHSRSAPPTHRAPGGVGIGPPVVSLPPHPQSHESARSPREGSGSSSLSRGSAGGYAQIHGAPTPSSGGGHPVKRGPITGPAGGFRLANPLHPPVAPLKRVTYAQGPQQRSHSVSEMLPLMADGEETADARELRSQLTRKEEELSKLQAENSRLRDGMMSLKRAPPSRIPAPSLRRDSMASEPSEASEGSARSELQPTSVDEEELQCLKEENFVLKMASDRVQVENVELTKGLHALQGLLMARQEKQKASDAENQMLRATNEVLSKQLSTALERSERLSQVITRLVTHPKTAPELLPILAEAESAPKVEGEGGADTSSPPQTGDGAAAVPAVVVKEKIDPPKSAGIAGKKPRPSIADLQQEEQSGTLHSALPPRPPTDHAHAKQPDEHEGASKPAETKPPAPPLDIRAVTPSQRPLPPSRPSSVLGTPRTRSVSPEQVPASVRAVPIGPVTLRTGPSRPSSAVVAPNSPNGATLSPLHANHQIVIQATSKHHGDSSGGPKRGSVDESAVVMDSLEEGTLRSIVKQQQQQPNEPEDGLRQVREGSFRVPTLNLDDPAPNQTRPPSASRGTTPTKKTFETPRQFSTRSRPSSATRMPPTPQTQPGPATAPVVPSEHAVSPSNGSDDASSGSETKRHQRLMRSQTDFLSKLHEKPGEGKDQAPPSPPLPSKTVAPPVDDLRDSIEM